MDSAFLRLAAAFNEAQIRYLLIGVAGANYYAPGAAALFTTQDHDVLLPLEPLNLLRAWETAMSLGLELWSGPEPLDQPRDLPLAEAIVARRALVRAVGEDDTVQVDLTLEMAGFDFDSAWAERREFLVEGIRLPVGRLTHIIRSKALANRDKDRLFLATHAEALRQLLHREESGDPS